jgi:hypothetical protein
LETLDQLCFPEHKRKNLITASINYSAKMHRDLEEYMLECGKDFSSMEPGKGKIYTASLKTSDRSVPASTWRNAE